MAWACGASGCCAEPVVRPPPAEQPSVGRVVNDVSTDIAAGKMSPKDAAKAIEDARKN